MKVIDNFLPKENFDVLKKLIFSKEFPWFFQDQVTFTKGNTTNYYFVHTLYYNNRINSNFYDVFENNLFNKLEMNSLIRAKANFYHKTAKLIKNKFHIDYEFPHKTALLYFNSNDGFTEFKNGTKIDSKENRLLIFDGLKLHKSTTCTNSKGRFNININYI
tara:strand:+ start:50 stop:532 length:483 start_codon:yes stop_codon:yes gene_type:complete